MSSIKVLYDGWPLIDQPNSPAALHLLAILARLPEAVQPVVALPDTPPAWLGQTPVHVQRIANTPYARLRWEQRVLPRLARQIGAALLHLTSTRVPLLDPAISVVSPCEFDFWDNARSDDRRTSPKPWDNACVNRSAGAVFSCPALFGRPTCQHQIGRSTGSACRRP
jgi:hypothetical protein